MYDRILPAKVDNTFQGHKLALWLFGVVLLVKTAQIISVLVDRFEVIKTADGIPLDTYTPATAYTLVTVFVAMAISRLAITIICAVALFRYRSALIFLFSLLAIHDGVREWVLHPVRQGTPIGVLVNLGLLVLTIAGLVLAAGFNKAGTVR